MIKACLYCGKETEMIHNQKYCGRQSIKTSCAYKVTLKTKSPLVKCVDCGAEMKRYNQSDPRCGNRDDPDSCSGKYAWSHRKRPSKFCAWCSEPLGTDDVRRKYHGSQSEIGSCAYQVQQSNVDKYNKNKSRVKKTRPKPKISYAAEGTKVAYDYWCC